MNNKNRVTIVGKKVDKCFVFIIAFLIIIFITTPIINKSQTDGEVDIKKNEILNENHIISLTTHKSCESETELITLKKDDFYCIYNKEYEEELYYLAAAICREAGGESEEIQLLVANVIINRVNSSLYPNTIYEVLTQYKQYGNMWKNGVSFPSWADAKTINQCYAIAERILSGERVCPANVLYQAEFEQGSGIYKQFGDDFYFCYG